MKPDCGGLIVWVVLGLYAANEACAEDAALRKRFETEAPVAWQEFQSKSNNLCVEYTQLQTSRHGVQEVHVVMKASPESALVHTNHVHMPTHGQLEGTQRVEARNPSYRFTLSRTESDDRWWVSSVASIEPADRATELVESIRLFPLRVFDRSLPEWIQQPGFEVLSVDWADRPSGRLVAVSFQCAKPEKALWISQGKLHLNPDRMWLIDEGEYIAQPNEKIQETAKQANYFRQAIASIPSLERAVLIGESSLGTVQTETKFDRFEPCQAALDQFTLTAFDLPEFGDLATPISKARRWGILLTIGLILILAAVLVRRMFLPKAKSI